MLEKIVMLRMAILNGGNQIFLLEIIRNRINETIIWIMIVFITAIPFQNMQK